MLLQFGHMGSSYMTKVMGGGKPATVGLLNVGTEDCKGGELQHEAFALLKDSGLNFLGNVEARDLPAGAADVVVADGFTGNVALKMMEGVADMIMKNIKGVFMSTLATKLAALVVKPHLGAFKKKMDTSEYGGAPLLGISKPVIKATAIPRPRLSRTPSGGGRIRAGRSDRGYRGGGGEERGINAREEVRLWKNERREKVCFCSERRRALSADYDRAGNCLYRLVWGAFD